MSFFGSHRELRAKPSKSGMEMKFVVMKVDDINQALNSNEIAFLTDIMDIVSKCRKHAGKPDNEYAVINTDEPYFPQIKEIMQAHGHWGTEEKVERKTKEIEFKAKAKEDDRWVYGLYSLCNFGAYPWKPTIIEIVEGQLIPIEVDPDTVCQYIGERDKLGKKIYEGDIDNSSDEFMYVDFKGASYGLKFLGEEEWCNKDYFDSCVDWSQTEICGNIHDGSIDEEEGDWE